jgi:SAM-dependent methyltransferase
MHLGPREAIGALGALKRWVVRPEPPLVETREAYRLWADTYPARPHNRLMEVEQQVMATALAVATPTRALDVGTGTGRNTPLLSAAGARSIVGLDLSMAMLARGRNGRPQVCADALRLPFADRAFDTVCSSLMVGDIEDVNGWIAESGRVLRRGGHLVYSDFHPAWAARGWRRTFTGADGRERQLAYFPHSMEKHLQGLRDHGFAVRMIREPRAPERPAPLVVLFDAVKQ